MKKFIAILTVTVLLISMMTVPTLAHKNNTKIGEVPKTADAITIDAIKDPVYDKGFIISDMGARFLDEDGLNEGRGTTAKAWALWDDGALYVYAEVYVADVFEVDENLQTNANWMCPSFELFIDLTNEDDDRAAIEQYRSDYTGYGSIDLSATEGVASYGNMDAADGFIIAAGRIIDGGYAIEFKAINPKIKAGDCGWLYQINDIFEDGTRAVLFQNSGKGVSWDASTFDYVTLVNTTVTGVEPEPEVVEDTPADDAAPVADDKPAAETKPVSPPTGNTGILILLAVAMMAATGIVVFRRQKAK